MHGRGRHRQATTTSGPAAIDSDHAGGEPRADRGPDAARGVSRNQASVSRDIREMGLVKLAGRYLPADRALAAEAGGAPGPELGG